ncbi:hypothetical protein HYU95_00505 [Candidatus Daviesbacteria bacterium]|nr:hypothetical protein [Candidatus Daviesbacteria bacterium]
MTNEVLKSTPFQIAQQEIPPKWYESDNQIRRWAHKAELIGFLPSFFALWSAFSTGNYTLPWYAHAISLGLLTISSMADLASTTIGLNAANKVSSLGIEHNIGETNPNLSSIGTPRDLLLNPTTYWIQLFGLAEAATLPGVGIVMTGRRILTTARNFRITRRLNRAIKIAQRETDLNTSC